MGGICRCGQQVVPTSAPELPHERVNRGGDYGAQANVVTRVHVGWSYKVAPKTDRGVGVSLLLRIQPEYLRHGIEAMAGSAQAPLSPGVVIHCQIFRDHPVPVYVYTPGVRLPNPCYRSTDVKFCQVLVTDLPGRTS